MIDKNLMLHVKREGNVYDKTVCLSMLEHIEGIQIINYIVMF